MVLSEQPRRGAQLILMQKFRDEKRPHDRNRGGICDLTEQ